MSSGKAPRTSGAVAPRRGPSSGAGPSRELAVWSTDEKIVMLVDSTRDLLNAVVHNSADIQELKSQMVANTGRLDTVEQRLTEVQAMQAALEQVGGCRTVCCIVVGVA